LDVFTSTLATFHTALSKKQDVYIQDGLKYAFPTRFTRKEAQLHRRKENLSHLRHHLNHLAKVLLLHKPLICPCIPHLLEMSVSVPFESRPSHFSRTSPC